MAKAIYPTQKFFDFKTLLLSPRISIRVVWIDLYMTYVILKSFSMSCGFDVFYPWKKITIFLICFLTKSLDNSWKNEPRRNIIRPKLASVARSEVGKGFFKKYRQLKLEFELFKDEIFRNFSNVFKSSHRSEFLSYNIPTGLIFSEIVQTFC